MQKFSLCALRRNLFECANPFVCFSVQTAEAKSSDKIFFVLRDFNACRCYFLKR